MTIGGRPIRTWVIQTKETVTGALHGDEPRKEWWSPALGVDVRVEWHRNLDVERSSTSMSVAPLAGSAERSLLGR